MKKNHICQRACSRLFPCFLSSGISSAPRQAACSGRCSRGLPEQTPAWTLKIEGGHSAGSRSRPWAPSLSRQTPRFAAVDIDRGQIMWEKPETRRVCRQRSVRMVEGSLLMEATRPGADDDFLDPRDRARVVFDSQRLKPVANRYPPRFWPQSGTLSRAWKTARPGHRSLRSTIS